MAMQIRLPNEGQEPGTGGGALPPAPVGNPTPTLPDESGQVPPPKKKKAQPTPLPAPVAPKKKGKGKGGGGGGAATPQPPNSASPLPPTHPASPQFQPAQITNPGIGSWYNQQPPPTFGPDPMDRRPYSGMGGGGAYGDFNDVYNMYLSTVPIMEANAQRQINSAMANAGFGGTRYGSAAMERAGQIGANTALEQNAMLNNLLYNQANTDLNRQMQAIPLEMQLGNMIEQGSQDRLAALMGFGGWEQGRMDDMAMKYYSDFEQNKYGFLPMLLQAATSQGPGYPGSPPSYIQTVTAGEPSTGLDILDIISKFF